MPILNVMGGGGADKYATNFFTKTGSSFFNSQISVLSPYMFWGWEDLKIVSLPNVTGIKSGWEIYSSYYSYKWYNRNVSLDYLRLDNLETITDYSASLAFEFTSELYLPKLKSISGYYSTTIHGSYKVLYMPEYDGAMERAFHGLVSDKVVVTGHQILSSRNGYGYFYSGTLPHLICPSCSTVTSMALKYCGIYYLELPTCTSFVLSAFSYSDGSVYWPSMVSMPMLSSIDGLSLGSGPYYKTNVKFANLAGLSRFNAFFYGTDIISIVATNLDSCSANEFSNCLSLKSFIGPNVRYIRSSAFRSCLTMSLCYFPVCESISSDVFANCYNLSTLYLLSTSVPICSGTNIFFRTPFTGYSGRSGNIYVRASLVDSFKIANEFSSVSSAIVGLTDEEIANLNFDQ